LWEGKGKETLDKRAEELVLSEPVKGKEPTATNLIHGLVFENRKAVEKNCG
jgi:hypothetical protein